MGRKKSKYYKRTLHQQTYDRFQRMIAFGESKTDAKKNGTTGNKIYSKSTYQTYKKHINYFVKYIMKTHPEVKSMKKAKKYVTEWLELRVAEGCSAWTINLEAAALNKFYEIAPDDLKRFQCPRRNRVDIKRSRGEKERDKHFSKLTNEELIHFCQACGFRRNVLERLHGDDLYDRKRVEQRLMQARKEHDMSMIKACEDALHFFSDQEYFILHRKDKGGKTRLAPIVGPHKDEIIRRMQNTAPNDLVWNYINSNCDVHGYRSDYATYLYKLYARPIKSLDYKKKILCDEVKDEKKPRSIRMRDTTDTYLEDTIVSYINEADPKNEQRELALIRILEIANSEKARGTHPELEPVLAAVDQTIATLVKQINAVVAGQDNTIAELKTQLSDAVALKNKLRDEADEQITEAKSKLKEAECMAAANADMIEQATKEVEEAKAYADTVVKLAAEKDVTIANLKEKLASAEEKMIEYTKMVEMENNNQGRIQELERALLESEKNHELEMHELQSEMKQKLSEAESKVQMEVFQAISDTEREVRNMYEEKLRDADKEVIRLQVQLEQLNSK